ncbi:hypothetical protein [Algoriphagus sp. A40]|uniref:hypothetical protein n=1 Tax=Algoriphagus sp. A40 TaxID=1945863 RepID=UPI0009848822|nr:hypothetical protein [Algoriphagus sp. A40]OOG69381.1 hypothetical protein B0E43_20490 [Algoriphagus sp. A40]
MKNALKILPALLLIISIFSCGEEDVLDPLELAGGVGFEGTLPDGSTFGTTGIRSGNGIGTIGVNGKYQGSHFLGIRTFDHKWSLNLESPSRPLPDDTPTGENVPAQVFNDLFNTYYPYEELLEVFLTEKSKADSDPNYTSFSKFRIQLANQEKYFSYLPENFSPSRGGVIRVLAIQEGIVKSLSGEDVRKIEVVVEFDLPMKASDPTIAAQEGKLKGTGQFRYREDFYQGEFEQ